MTVNYEPQAPIVKLVKTEGSVGNKLDAAIEQYGLNLGSSIKAAAAMGAAGLAGKVLLKDTVEILEDGTKKTKPGAMQKGAVAVLDKVADWIGKGGDKLKELGSKKQPNAENISNLAKSIDGPNKVYVKPETIINKASKTINMDMPDLKKPNIRDLRIKNALVKLGGGLKYVTDKFKGLSGKTKIFGTLATVTGLTLGKIMNNNAYNEGRIDQKHETRAKLQQNVV